MYQRKPDGLYICMKTKRVMEHQGYVTRIHWDGNMLSFLCRHFATTLNDELAECLGVSPRTMIRKARELGLQKGPKWLRRIWDERRFLAQVACKKMGHPGGFKKGVHNNPAGEFKKGEPRDPEMQKKCSQSMRRWYMTHPAEAKAKARKAWETRRQKSTTKTNTLFDRQTNRY